MSDDLSVTLAVSQMTKSRSGCQHLTLSGLKLIYLRGFGILQVLSVVACVSVCVCVCVKNMILAAPRHSMVSNGP